MNGLLVGILLASPLTGAASTAAPTTAAPTTAAPMTGQVVRMNSYTDATKATCGTIEGTSFFPTGICLHGGYWQKTTCNSTGAYVQAFADNTCTTAHATYPSRYHAFNQCDGQGQMARDCEVMTCHGQAGTDIANGADTRGYQGSECQVSSTAAPTTAAPTSAATTGSATTGGATTGGATTGTTTTSSSKLASTMTVSVAYLIVAVSNL